jgi:hypothetical protein
MSHSLTWSYAFHAARQRDRRAGDRPMKRRAGEMFLTRPGAGVMERSLDQLVAILAVVGVRSW